MTFVLRAVYKSRACECTAIITHNWKWWKNLYCDTIFMCVYFGSIKTVNLKILKGTRTSYPSYHELNLKRNSSRTLCSISNGTYYCIFWNLESGIRIILLPAEFRMQIHTEFRGIPGSFTPKNTTEFRMFFKKFRIPSEVKNALPWTP